MPRQSLKTKIETALKGDKNSEMVDKPNEEVENIKQEEDLSAIKSQQTYSKKVFEDFASFTAKNSKAMIVIYICSAIILLCSIALFITGDIFRAIIEVFFGVFFACYGQVIKFIMRQNNKKNYNSTDCYEFAEDTLNVKCKDANGVLPPVQKLVASSISAPTGRNANESLLPHLYPPFPHHEKNTVTDHRIGYGICFL